MSLTAAAGDCRTRSPLRLSFPSYARRTALVLGLLLGTQAHCAHAQQGGVHGGAGQAAPGTGRPSDADPLGDPALEKRLELARNTERQKALIADTQKLLLLAQQLHDEVEKTRSDQLSVDVVRTSAQIEKLAKSVNEKMRGY